MIKGHQTQTAKGCCGLSAERRWCLSGTPIQNNIVDLYSYFRFLKYEPYSKFRSFSSMLKDPVSRDTSHGYKKFQTVLRIVLLRRTKGEILTALSAFFYLSLTLKNLPNASFCLQKLFFSIGLCHTTITMNIELP